MKVYNATRHWQTGELPQWSRLGVEFVPSPGPGVNSLPPQSSVDRVVQEADDAMAKIRSSGADAVLVGGITGIAVLIAIKSAMEGFRVIEPSIASKDSSGAPIITGYRDLTHYIEDLLMDAKS